MKLARVVRLAGVSRSAHAESCKEPMKECRQRTLWPADFLFVIRAVFQKAPCFGVAPLLVGGSTGGPLMKSTAECLTQNTQDDLSPSNNEDEA